MKIAVIGVGLIGGSFALTLKQKNIATHIIGIDSNELHIQAAMDMGIIDSIATVDQLPNDVDIILVAIPVDKSVALLPTLLDVVTHQTVIDVGSTKSEICAVVRSHPKRKQFVATHPMWGTEYSGPQAAICDPFHGKVAVICNRKDSDNFSLTIVDQIYSQLGFRIINMDAAAHDMHAAYISHISHITSFALANTVLEKEKEENAIFDLASGGFESTVRLAKSNKAMWVPIFRQNKENVLDVLNEHITQLRKFKSAIEKDNWEYLGELVDNANKIKRILKG